MKVTEKKMADGRIKLTAIASTAEVSKAFDIAQNMFAQNMNVFVAPGMSVAQAVEAQLGVSDLDGIVRQQAFECLVPFALDKHNLTPAFPPQPSTDEALRRGKTFTFELEVTPKPEYELTSYEPVTITVPALEISPAEVDAQIAQILDGFARYVAAEPHAVGEGDAFKLSMETSKGGEPVQPLCTDERMYIMGAGYMPQDFESNLMGMNVGETKTFSFELPGFGSEEAETAECTVTVKEMLQREEPELTDEWVASMMPLYRSAAALREAVEAEIVRERTAQYDAFKMQLANAELGKRFEGSIADEVYEAVRGQLIGQLRANLQRQGIDFEQFVASQGGEQQFGMMLMLQTRQVVVQGYVLDALYRHEKLEITDEDILAACAELNPQNPALVKQAAEENGTMFALREIAQRRKASVWLLENATNVIIAGEDAE